MSKKIQDENQKDFQLISQSTELFSWELLKTVADYNVGNLVISPLSVNIALAMASYGACEKTADEIKKVLHLSKNDPANKKYFKTLIDESNNVEGVTLNVATRPPSPERIKVITGLS